MKCTGTLFIYLVHFIIQKMLSFMSWEIGSSRKVSAVTKFSIISLHGPYRNKVWGYRLDTTGLWED